MEDLNSAFLEWTAQLRHENDRRRLELLWNEYPKKARKHLFARLQSRRLSDYLGASFELLIHGVLNRLGCEVDVLDVDGSGANPDFLVRHQDRECFVEATIVMPKGGTDEIDPNCADVLGKIGQIPSPDFDLLIQIGGKLEETLSASMVKGPILRLLTQNDPETVQQIIHCGGSSAAPSEELSHGNWRLRASLEPKPNRQECPSRKLRYTVVGSLEKDVTMRVKDSVVCKARKYKSSHEPMVVAVNPLSGFFNSENDDLEALFGKEQVRYVEDHPEIDLPMTRKRDGIWVGGSESRRYTRPAAVLICRGITPTVVAVPVNMYLNPFMDEADLPKPLYRLPHAKGKGGGIRWIEGVDIAALLSTRSMPGPVAPS